MTAEIVVVNFYTLRDPDGFDRALRALVPRVRLQGHVGLRSYRFFGSGPKERRLVAIYQGPEAWVGHHDLIMTWGEMIFAEAHYVHDARGFFDGCIDINGLNFFAHDLFYSYLAHQVIHFPYA